MYANAILENDGIRHTLRSCPLDGVGFVALAALAALAALTAPAAGVGNGETALQIHDQS